MLASEHTAAEFALPAFDARALARRAAVPALVAGAAVLVAVVAGGRVHAFVDGVRRGLTISPGWGALGAAFECVSLVGYVGLMSLVAGRATRRIGTRESAQITLAGTAATRLLPTAGAGGLALSVWALRRAGLQSRAATRTLLTFLVVLYSVFLGAIVVSATVLAIGVAGHHGPVELSAIPAVAAALAIALCLVLGLRGDAVPETATGSERLARVKGAARLLGGGVRDAVRLIKSGDPRLAGAIAYWAFDAAVLWAMLRAFGAAPALPVVVLAYFVGQLANTVPVPGSVSSGMAGVLIAFGLPAELAIAAVLAYRGISVWLPTPVALAAIPGLRATVARWSHEDAARMAS